MTNEQAGKLYDRIKTKLAAAEQRKRETTAGHADAFGWLASSIEDTLDMWPEADRGDLKDISLEDLPL